MEEDVVDNQPRCQVVDMLPDRQQRRHHGISRFHYGVGDEYPQQGLPESRPRFVDIEQIA